MGLLRSITAWCLDLVFPKACAGCGTEGDFLCASCRTRLVPRVPACPVCSRRNFTGLLCGPCAGRAGLRRFLAPFAYADPLVRELIHTYKYGGARELAPLLAGEAALLLERYRIRPHGPAVIVPIPLARSRERARGFNQARLLAQAIGARLGLPVAEALRRVRATPPQVGLIGYQARQANVAGALLLADAAAVLDRTVILVDDVSTSGATLTEAARALRAAGARTVWAIVIAKG